MSKKPKIGLISVYTGPIYSGKTNRLIKEVQQALDAGQKVQVFRFGTPTNLKIESHSGQSLHATPVMSSTSIRDGVFVDTTVVVIDDIHLFDLYIAVVCHQLALQGKQVIVAGRRVDVYGNIYLPIPHILAYAEGIIVLPVKCSVCAAVATRTQQVLIWPEREDLDQPVNVEKAFEPRCRRCHTPEPVVKGTPPSYTEEE